MRETSSLFKSMFILGMLFLFNNSELKAEQQDITLSHPISLPSEFNRSSPATGTLNIIAVRVEFDADTNRFTSGTGVFGDDGFDGLPYLTNQDVTHIDPLPHNQTYFETHLEFARNYFSKSSDNQLDINYQVLPQVYQLDKKMEEYSPIGETFTLEKIAELFRDVWAKVEEQGGFDTSGLDPDFTAFVIFHAGVGRDVELTGTSLDITPFDLPSITLKEADLQDLLDEPTFDGFSINNGTFKINNSLLIPRTQSRRGEDISGSEIVFPLSINGLLCASIGSYLGLPDLFNTTNGQPGIGRFGLMDGAGIFNYNGLFPAEPSAWEKVYLGWETPKIIPLDSLGLVELPATSLDIDQSIAKIELSSSEYFLIENRHRDPNLEDSVSAKVTLTIRSVEDGSLVQQTFTNFDEDFIFQTSEFDTLLIPGTLVDVSNFDWGLPGGIDIGEDEEEGTEDDRHLNGGILIWHIDDAIISQNISTNSVNADDLNRGVDLEEGDGAQDIGRDPGLLDNTPSFGFAYDFWWGSNNYRVITNTTTIDLNPDNEFGPDTYPNNDSNSGGRSNFELLDFSEVLPTASFRIRELNSTELGYELIGSSQYDSSSPFSTGEEEYHEYFPLSISIQNFRNDTVVVIPSTNSLYLNDLSGTNPFSSFILGLNNGIYTQPLNIEDEFIVLYSRDDATTKYDANIPGSLTSTVLIVSGGSNDIGPAFGFISSQDGINIEYDFNNLSIHVRSGNQFETNSGYEFRSEIIDNKFVGINGNTVEFVGENLPEYTANYQYRLFAGTIQSNIGNYYYLFEDGTFSIVDPRKEEAITEIFSEEKAEWPAIVDEGHIYRINTSTSAIEGFNFGGATLSGTPIYSEDDIQFVGTPLLADITGDNIQDLLVVGQNNSAVNIYAFEKNGTPIEGFPLYVGGATDKDDQPIHPVFFEDVLYAISHSGDLRAWRFLNFTSSQWPSRYGESQLNKVSAYIEFDTTTGENFSVLNKTETYNWPNPANDVTNIRFELAEPGGNVEITIIDYSGRIIFERTVQSVGGIPEEIQINTQDWGNGAYFARIKASVEGKSETEIIKIGIAH